MKTAFYRYLAFALALLVAMTGQGLAASRGMNTAVGQMVICTGTGPVVVFMDESGQPAKPPHYCPDYALALLGAVTTEDPLLPPPPGDRFPDPARDARSLISLPVPQTPARSPPVSI